MLALLTAATAATAALSGWRATLYAAGAALVLGFGAGAYVTNAIWSASDLRRQHAEWKHTADFVNEALAAQIALSDEYAESEAANREAEPQIEAEIAAIPSGGPVCARAGVLRALEKLR